MPVYALVLWTVVAVGPIKEYHDWRPIASFRGEALCKEGAKKLGLDDTRFKCIRLELQ